MNRLWESTEAQFIGQSIENSEYRHLAITSGEDSAGKTTVCKMLAAYLCYTKNRHVIYVDLNQRNPYIQSQEDQLFAEQPDTLEVRRLPGNFAKLPEFERQHILKEITYCPNANSFLILDTSPLGIFNRLNIHPVSLKDYCDAFVLVTNKHTTNRRDILNYKKLLAEHTIPIAGVVINNFENPSQCYDPASLSHWKEHGRIAYRWFIQFPLIKRIFNG